MQSTTDEEENNDVVNMINTLRYILHVTNLCVICHTELRVIVV